MRYTFSSDINSISPNYRRKVTIAIAAIIVQHFTRRLSIPTQQEIAKNYGIPSRLVTDTIDRLLSAGIINTVMIDSSKEIYGYTPAVDPSLLTVRYVLDRINSRGRNNFIPQFDKHFPGVETIADRILAVQDNIDTGTRLADLSIELAEPHGRQKK